MKKVRILTCMLLVCMVFSVSVGATAAGIPKSSEFTEENISTRAEEVQYYYREVDGRVQYRIWSLTYGYWLTDWAWA